MLIDQVLRFFVLETVKNVAKVFFSFVVKLTEQFQDVGAEEIYLQTKTSVKIVLKLDHL